MAMGLRIIDRQGETWQAALEGELNIYTVASLKSEFSSWPATHVDIDLSLVSDIDSAGLQWMLMLKRCDGRTVSFSKHSPEVQRLIETAQLAGSLGDPMVFQVGDPSTI